jgi:hypothetical protein
MHVPICLFHEALPYDKEVGGPKYVLDDGLLIATLR